MSKPPSSMSKPPSKLSPHKPSLSLKPNSPILLSTLLSSAANNPFTFLLLQASNPPNLLRTFTSPIPVSLSLRRSPTLLLLAALIVAGAVFGLIVFSPLIVTASIVVFTVVLGLSSLCAVGVVSVAAVAWMVQRFFRAHNPLRADHKLCGKKDAAGRKGLVRDSVDCREMKKVRK